MTNQFKNNKNAIIQTGGSIKVGGNLDIGDKKIVLLMDDDQNEVLPGLLIRYKKARNHLQRNETDQAIDILKALHNDALPGTVNQQIEKLQALRTLFQSNQINQQAATIEKQKINQALTDILDQYLQS